MKRKLKITVSLILMIFILTAVLYSCKTENAKKETANLNTEAPETFAEQETVATEEDRSIADDLGEFDFGGYEFKIYNRIYIGFADYRLDFEGYTGDVYQDAVFTRNRAIEDRFNVKITTVQYEDHSAPRKILLAGTNDYDLYTCRADHAFIRASEGLINSVDVLEYIDLNKTYWNEFLTEQVSFMNKKFFAVGSFNFSILDTAEVLVFNKQLIQDYGLENPFELVKQGGWTYDKFNEMCRVGTSDLDGDGLMKDTDAWGYVCRSNDVMPSLWVSAGVTAAEKDEKGVPQNVMGTEKFLAVADKIFEITWGSEVYYNSEKETMFIGGNVLFNDSTPHKLLALRAMETDFGILPYPKFNQQQENYYTRLGACELFFTAKSAPKELLDRAGIILEAMACESLKSCVPSYYDLMLKTKLARDIESEEIIDMIFDCRVFDWVDIVWTSELRDGPLNDMFVKKNNTLVSLNESKLSNIFDKKRDSIVEAISGLN